MQQEFYWSILFLILPKLKRFMKKIVSVSEKHRKLFQRFIKFDLIRISLMLICYKRSKIGNMFSDVSIIFWNTSIREKANPVQPNQQYFTISRSWNCFFINFIRSTSKKNFQENWTNWDLMYIRYFKLHVIHQIL